jgi:hypothetical protein
MGQYNIQFRPYDFEKDPEQIVKYLYTDYQSSEGIQSIRVEDSIFKNKQKDNIRFVAEINGELHSSLVLMRDDEETSFSLYSLVTSEQMRGIGLASGLFAYAKVWVKLQSGLVIRSSTAIDNIRAQKFFEGNKFKIIKTTNDEVFYEYYLA